MIGVHVGNGDVGQLADFDMVLQAADDAGAAVQQDFGIAMLNEVSRAGVGGAGVGSAASQNGDLHAASVTFEWRMQALGGAIVDAPSARFNSRGRPDPSSGAIWGLPR